MVRRGFVSRSPSSLQSDAASKFTFLQYPIARKLVAHLEGDYHYSSCVPLAKFVLLPEISASERRTSMKLDRKTQADASNC